MLVELLDEEAAIRGRRHVACRRALVAVNLGEARSRGRGRGGREVAARAEHTRAEQGGRAALAEHSGVGCGEGGECVFWCESGCEKAARWQQQQWAHSRGEDERGRKRSSRCAAQHDAMQLAFSMHARWFLSAHANFSFANIMLYCTNTLFIKI